MNVELSINQMCDLCDKQSKVIIIRETWTSFKWQFLCNECAKKRKLLIK